MPEQRRSAVRAELRRLSQQAHHGSQIHVHRSLDTLGIRGAGLLTVFILPIAITAIYVIGYENLLSVWGSVLRFGLDRLGIAGAVEPDSVTFLWGSLPVLSVRAISWYPSAFLLWLTLGLVASVVAVTCYLPVWALPISYVVRAACLLQTIAIVFFFAWPESFPYGVQQHVRDCFALGVTIIGLVPWIHALTFYVFDFGILRKIGLTACTMVFLVCYLPLKILIHVYVLDRFSLLFMPLLFLVFGVAIDVFVLIALYAWGMSWRAAAD